MPWQTGPEGPYPMIDRILVVVLGVAQLLCSILGFLVTWGAFMYGGALAHPGLFAGLNAYWVAGVLTAGWSFFGQLIPRIVAIIWYTIGVGFLALDVLKPRYVVRDPSNGTLHYNTDPPGILEELILFFGLMVLGYLVLSVIMRLILNRRKHRGA